MDFDLEPLSSICSAVESIPAAAKSNSPFQPNPAGHRQIINSEEQNRKELLLELEI